MGKEINKAPPLASLYNKRLNIGKGHVLRGDAKQKIKELTIQVTSGRKNKAVKEIGIWGESWKQKF